MRNMCEKQSRCADVWPVGEFICLVNMSVTIEFSDNGRVCYNSCFNAAIIQESKVYCVFKDRIQ